MSLKIFFFHTYIVIIYTFNLHNFFSNFQEGDKVPSIDLYEDSPANKVFSSHFKGNEEKFSNFIIF